MQVVVSEEVQEELSAKKGSLGRMARAFVSSSFDFWQHVEKKEAVALQQKAPQMTDPALEEEEEAALAAVVLRLTGNRGQKRVANPSHCQRGCQKSLQPLDHRRCQQQRLRPPF